MGNCKFLRQKKQVKINGEWVDTRSYRYLPYCDVRTPSIVIKNSKPYEEISYGLKSEYPNMPPDYKHITLDENGNGYIELKSDDILDVVDLPDGKYYPSYQSSELEIKGCTVTTPNLYAGYGKIVFTCSKIISDDDNHNNYYNKYKDAYSYIYNGVDTSKSTNMGGMFYECVKLTSLDLSGWNVSNVTDMSIMFDGCSGLTSLDLSGWNVSNVVDMHYMFSNCRNITSLDISRWNVSNVVNMGGMFYGCSGLTSLDISRWNVSNVTDMGFMFAYCESLTSLDLSGWNVSKLKCKNHIFAGCSSLQTLDISGWDLTDDCNVEMFVGCKSLRTIYMRNCPIFTIFSIEDSLKNAHILDQVTIIRE